MNRRQFAQSLGALAAAPLMPNIALAAPQAAPAIPAGAVKWASYLTKMHDACTPEMLGTLMRVSPTEAASMTRQLVASNLITPAQSIGKTAVQAVAKSTKAPQVTQELRERVVTHLRDIDHEISIEPENRED